jgi:hypothetical protein
MQPAYESTTTGDAALPAGVEKALSALLRAYEYAHELRHSGWEFAVALSELRFADFTSSDLRWLACRGYVELAVETTTNGARQRSFRPARRTVIAEKTCAVLTEPGARFARSRHPRQPERPSRGPRTIPLNACPRKDEPGPRPRWDESRRQLRVGGLLVKHFRQPAPNQEIILSAFEEEGWPPRIDDPLSPRPDRDSRLHLHETIVNLNRYHRDRVIRFFGDGKGEGVCWEIVDE